MENLLQTISDFVNFGEKKLGLDYLDAVQARNKLYAEFKVYPDGDILKAKALRDVNYYVDYFTNYYKKQKLDDVNIGIKVSYLFDIISPRPSEVYKTFNSLYKKDPKAATLYLYNLGIDNYYIHKRDIDKNVEWKAHFSKGSDIEISINLSKPEKDNKDIAKLLSAKSVANYPKCVLCLENLGFEGNAKKAPRHNIRVIPLKFNGEDWFMQYSPYGYFKEHMILVDSKHEYMEISPRIFGILFAFLKKFPHYSIVSNADLPIVGGSILNHEHFQGGNYIFPLQKAKDLFVVKNKMFKHTKISVLDFYNTAFKFVGKDDKEILKAVSYVFKKWCTYSDKSVEIIASKEGKRQNTITPIVRKNNKGEYEFIAILRNNGVSEKYPDGIYHVHPEYFAIKKEGIGVIEAMGRFILPARLVRQIKEVEDVIKHKWSKSIYTKKYPDLANFDHMINTMKEKKMTAKEYINEVGKNILDNTSVFKKDEKGMNALKKFIKSLCL